MFYWVKSPIGEELDYNASELRKALEEGRVQPDWPARGNEQTSWSNVANVLEHESAEPNQPEESAVNYVSFVCGRCKNHLRIELPLKEVVYSCPECATLYQCSKVAEDPLVYVLIPDLKEFQAPAESTPPPRQK